MQMDDVEADSGGETEAGTTFWQTGQKVLLLPPITVRQKQVLHLGQGFPSCP